MSLIQSLELFQVLFLSELVRKLDKKLYTLKGGCNLRFFLKSPRLSEDIDFDVQTISLSTLQKKIDKTINSQPFLQILKTRKIEIVEVTKPKQTQTTQRWKIGLKTPGTSNLIRTKLEFSRRGVKEEKKFEPIDSDLSHFYQIIPFFCSHYPSEIAFQQKIEALINRKETQARDIFDLDLLLRTGVNPKNLSKETKQDFLKVKDIAFSINFDAFKGQVLAYLPVELQKQYGSKEVWNAMVLRIVKSIS